MFWWLKLIGAILLGLVCLGLLVFVGVSIGFRFSTPYQLALERVQSSKEAEELLGAPVAARWWFVTGSVSTRGPGGEAALSIPVAGSKEKGVLHIEAERSAGQWEIEELILETDEARIEIKNSRNKL